MTVRHKLNSWLLLQHLTKGLRVPEGGWTRASFARQGTLLALAIARAAKITQRKAAPEMASRARVIFRDQINQLLLITTGKKGQFAERPSTVNLVDLLFPQHEALWMQTIERVFSEGNARIVRELTPPVQGVMAQGYSRVNVMLGQLGKPEENANISRRARGIAEKITRVNDTTRRVVARIVRDSIDQNRNVTETAAEIRRRATEINDNRVMTIARTELGRAWDNGAAESYKQSSTISHLSVIGCTAREPDSPKFDGQSTCNIQDVPISRVDELMEVGWHINHQGSLIPSRFKE